MAILSRPQCVKSANRWWLVAHKTMSITSDERRGIFVLYITDHLALTHWGKVMHLCVGKLTIIGSDNGLSPGWRQAIIRTNVGILSIGPLETNFSEILIEMYIFSFKKLHLKMSSGKWQPFCLGLKVLKYQIFFAVYDWVNTLTLSLEIYINGGK